MSMPMPATVWQSSSSSQPSAIHIISHCSPKAYRINPPEGRFDRIEKDIRTYQKVRISGDTLVVTAFNAENGNADRLPLHTNPLH